MPLSTDNHRAEWCVRTRLPFRRNFRRLAEPIFFFFFFFLWQKLELLDCVRFVSLEHLIENAIMYTNCVNCVVYL
jgi:hypothetical protein